MIAELIRLAEKAGRTILEVYAKADHGVTRKTDDSPLTAADTASHDLILKGLGELKAEWPVLSEESMSVPYERRNAWDTFWLVDPLDGTKEFIKRNGEFTVNIALVRSGVPVVGVVHAPALGVTYYAQKGEGAFKKPVGERALLIRSQISPSEKFKVVLSRSHRGRQVDEFLKRLGPYEPVSIGSSLKLCFVAEGRAHLYPRFWPSMEWDTAAAQCLIAEAGGYVRQLDGSDLVYNKKDLINPYFVAGSKGTEEMWQ